MRHRFFVPDRIAAGATIALDGDERHHARVLRVREGEEVEVFDSDGNNFLARFESPEKIQIVEATVNREPSTEIRLAMSIIQLEKFELVLQKATELGVASFIPLITDRIEVRLGRIRGKGDRWKRIVLEAVKQSGRSKIPPIEAPAKFDDAIARPGARIMFDADVASATQQPGNPVTLFIGPEGGFSEREMDLARAAGASFERLGPRRLRAETAAIAAVTLVSARSGDI
jgi:16S rRNA (uracil1498-N3)-methyltransferase